MHFCTFETKRELPSKNSKFLPTGVCGLEQEDESMRWYKLDNYRETIAERNNTDVRLLDNWILNTGQTAAAMTGRMI